MQKVVILPILFSILLSCNQKPEEKEQITTIAFGSCSDQALPEQMWSEIASQQPDYFVLLGDNVYADKMNFEKMTAAYDIHKNSPGYTELKKVSEIYGVWDDHDYGSNDGGVNHMGKDSAQIALLNFLDIPPNDPLRSQQGVYQSHDLVSEGKLIKLLLLDTRYYRDTLYADTLSKARYFPNESGDILGEKQWAWLENEFSNSKADLHIVVSGTQIIADEQGYEKWANFPVARQRLFDLIKKHQPKRVMFLSGDRHIAEVSKLSLDNYPTAIYDLTSSGLSHTWDQVWEESNRYRVGELIIKRNYGLLSITWRNNVPEVSFEVKGHKDSTFLSLPIEF